jgi:hypothetical protein
MIPEISPARELRDTCAVVGAATSRLGKVPGVSSLDLIVEAISRTNPIPTISWLRSGLA